MGFEDRRMARVVEIGGVFFRSRDPKALAAWYGDTLGFEVQEWGGVVFPLRERSEAPKGACQVWSTFAHDTNYFDPGTREFMINFEVDDLDAVVARLEGKGVKVAGHDDNEASGKFAWFVDPEGTKVELWQPKDS
ncbi:MAG: VOC family protein [Alphaproteobacteria bacterium]